MSLFGDQIECGTSSLRLGDSRESVHRQLGDPSDPGKLSSARPSHYESYHEESIRLMVKFQGDSVTGFIFTRIS